MWNLSDTECIEEQWDFVWTPLRFYLSGESVLSIQSSFSCFNVILWNYLTHFSIQLLEQRHVENVSVCFVYSFIRIFSSVFIALQFLDINVLKVLQYQMSSAQVCIIFQEESWPLTVCCIKDVIMILRGSAWTVASEGLKRSKRADVEQQAFYSEVKLAVEEINGSCMWKWSVPCMWFSLDMLGHLSDVKSPTKP